MTGFELWNEINDSLEKIDYAIEYMGVPDKAKYQILNEKHRICSLANLFLKETERHKKDSKKNLFKLTEV